MTKSRTTGFRGVGLSLALRLYLLLAAICAPAFLLYYVYNMRTIEALRDRQVHEIVSICSFRLDDWLSSLPAKSLDGNQRELLRRELKRVVEEFNGLDSLSLFVSSPTGEIKLLASHGNDAPMTPSLEDKKALIDESTITVSTVRGSEQYRSVSIPLRSDGSITGAIHMEISPDRVAPSIPYLRRSTVLGAIQLMLAIGIGVVCFFHIAVGKPTQRLLQAMQSATDGDLAKVVPVCSGEFGRLGHSYNQMMLQLRSSIEENRGLLEQVRGFNEELRAKVKKATEALETKQHQLQAANEKLFSTQRHMTRLEKLASLGQAATILAHELGTPLNAISGHLQLMKEEHPADGKVNGRFRVIHEQVDRLSRIVRDVLETMRMPPVQLAPVDLSAVIQGVVDLIVPMIEKQGIALQLRLEPDLPRVHADAGQIEQLLMNLLTNAMDAMKGGGRLTVSAAFVEERESVSSAEAHWITDPEQCWIRVDVEDTGAGMAAEVAERAFEPFFSTKRMDGEPMPGIRSGLGLGLAICQQIVKNHGGDISISSEMGRGTRFRIFFPVGPGPA